MNSKRWREEEFDHLLKEVLQEELDKEPPIDSATSYKQFKQLQKKRGKERKARKGKWMILVPASLVLLIGFMLSPLNTNAFNHLTEFLQKMQGKSINISLGSEKPSEDDPALSDTESAYESPRLLQQMEMNVMRDKYHFPVMYPRYEGLNLIHSYGVVLHDAIIEVQLVYYHELTEKEIRIIQKDIRDTGVGMMVSQEDTNTKDIMIQESPGMYIEYDTGLREIMWVKHDLLVEVGGEIEEDKLLEIANSIR